MFRLNYKIIAVCLLGCVLSLSAAGLFPAFAQADDAAAIRSVVERFFAAYQKEDLEGSMSLWSEQSPDLSATRRSLQQTFNDYSNIEVKRIDVGKATIEAGKAKVQISLEVTASDAKTGKPATVGFGKMFRTMQLIQDAGAWKIWRYVSGEEDFAADLLAAKNEEERKLLLDRNRERVTSELVRELNKQGRTLFSQSKYPQALRLYEVGLSVARMLDDKTGAALILIGVGNAHYVQGNYTKASEAYQESLKLAEQANSKTDMARAWSSIGTLLYAQGNYAEALDLYLKSLKLREEAADKTGIATLLGNIAGIYYLQGGYDQALEYQQRGLKLSEELGDKSGISAALNNIGSLYLTQGDYLRALEMKQKNLKLKEELGDKPGIINALNTIGQVYYENGNYQQALDSYEKGLVLSREIGNKAGTATILANMGNVHYSQGNYARALDLIQEGLKLNQELGDKTNIAGSLNNLANVYRDQGNHARALEMLQQSNKLAEELGYERVIASTLTNIAQSYISLGQHQLALDYANRAISLTRQSDNVGITWQALTAAGQASMALAQYDLARRSFLDAISIIEKLREQAAGGEQDRQRFFENKVSPYYAMVDLSIKQNDTTQALLYAERAKGRVVLDVLSSGRVNIAKAMTREEIARDQAFTAEVKALNTYIARLKASPPPADISQPVARLEKVRLEYEAFQTSLYAAHPELRVQRGQSHTLTMDEATKLLPDDRAALLEYVVGDENSYLFVITRAARQAGGRAATLKVYPLTLGRKELAEASESFRQQLAERDLAIKTPARRLYDLLLKSAEKQLQGMNKLVIVPDGPLWDLPFQALYRGARGYLLEEFAISYAPSLSVLRDMNRKASEFSAVRRGAQSVVSTATQPVEQFRPELFAMGNPALDRETMTRISLVRADESLGPLPDAEREVNSLGELYGRDRSKVFTREQATEEEVKAEAGKYLILHFATHAILDDGNPMYSRIILSPAGNDGHEDGLLEAWELMKLDLTAAMVVLSACQTARGRVGAGEGMIGMSWALFVAGSPSVVVSQWKVDSARTTDLMLEFYRNLLRRKPGNKAMMTKPEALRLAAMKLLHSQYNHPAYWAGFVLIGSGYGDAGL